MLHTKFRRNQPAGSGEEDCEGVLPYMGMAAILVMFLAFSTPTFLRKWPVFFLQFHCNC